MSEATEEIERLRAEVERLETVDSDREKYFALMKEKGSEIEQHFNVMTKERNRFNASINRIAEIVGLSGKQCFAPEAVERQAKFELATLRGRVEELEGKRFPIQGGPSIPWRMIGPHDRQCSKNHCGQDLERIAERKGLSPAEALCVLDDQSWMESPWGNFMNDEAKSKAAHDELERRRAAFEDETIALRDWKESALKVEAAWDPQEVAKELGLKLNDDIRPNILPSVKALRMDLEKVTEQFHDTIKSRGEIIQQRDEARTDRDGYRFGQDQEHAEVERLKKAAIDCDQRILGCPVVTPEEVDLLDPAEELLEEADSDEGHKEVYGPGSIPLPPGADPNQEIILGDQAGDPIIAEKKGLRFEAGDGVDEDEAD